MPDVRYGPMGQYSAGVPVGMGASEVVKARSGRFAVNDGSGRAEIADDGDSEIIGWVEVGEQTCSSTEGATKATLIRDLDLVFRIPLAYDASTYTVNYASTLLWKTCDLKVVSTYQKANLTTADDDVLIVVGGKAATSSTADDGYVDVMMNPAKFGATGVA